MEDLRLLVFDEDGRILHDATEDLLQPGEDTLIEEILKQSVMSEEYGRFFFLRNHESKVFRLL